jgi:hypothetical protein
LVLWFHLGGRWKYQGFVEMEGEEVDNWCSLYGKVHQVAEVTHGGRDLYMAVERMENEPYYVWIIY